VTANGTDLAWYGSNSPTKVGWTIGGGVEYAITNNISLRAEYLYYDLGKQTTIAAPNAAVLATPALNGVYLTTRTQFDGSIFRIGANYKF
jgi:outer membrane immunogenic protein